MVPKIKIVILILSFYFKIIDSEVTTYYLKKKIRENKMLLSIAANLLDPTIVRSQSVWCLEHSSTFWEVDCQKNGSKFFKENFRMKKSSFDELCSLLKKMTKKDTNYRDAIPLEKRVAIALYALGSSSEYRSIAHLFGVGKATVCKIFIEFCNEVWASLAPIYLNNFPLKRSQIEQGVADFNAMGYPQCIGAIDGCHIEIHPKKEEAIDYHNYKGWYSVVLLALVDAKYRFSYIHCGSPGRCNDSSIFEKSSLKRELQECALLDELSWQYGSTKIPVHVIGDSAFRLSQHLMKPYPHSVNNTPEQKKFNYRLSKCRRVVENAFGHLKARFRRIGKGVDNHIKNANTVICAACVLHNFLIAQKDSIVENWVVEMQRDSRCNPQCSNNQSDRSEGELIRNSLKEYF
ncbi:PREDICTED: putative nuclease HARBI1, partial [Rhagoletis zephyria]|uniref:putative nuclease HARBI1 n=1 Tax=Rhagoletis zephyria TaxID=28612 RepID=UPI0008116B67